MSGCEGRHLAVKNQDANSVSLAHAPQETERQCLDAKADSRWWNSRFKFGFFRTAAHAPRGTERQCLDAKADVTLEELKLQIRFLSHCTEQLVGRISMVVCDAERASAVAAKSAGTR